MNILHLIPNLEEDELRYIQEVTKDLNENQLEQFAIVYNSRRKDPQTILLLTLVGFLGIAGVQRFVIDQIGMGILYVLTAGLCLIGTIVDLVNYKKLAFEYNVKAARQAVALTLGSFR